MRHFPPVGNAGGLARPLGRAEPTGAVPGSSAGRIPVDSRLTIPATVFISGANRVIRSWVTCCKVRQRTVTPPGRPMPGSIPGSPTIPFPRPSRVTGVGATALPEDPPRRIRRARDRRSTATDWFVSTSPIRAPGRIGDWGGRHRPVSTRPTGASLSPVPSPTLPVCAAFPNESARRNVCPLSAGSAAAVAPRSERPSRAGDTANEYHRRMVKRRTRFARSRFAPQAVRAARCAAPTNVTPVVVFFLVADFEKILPNASTLVAWNAIKAVTSVRTI